MQLSERAKKILVLLLNGNTVLSYDDLAVKFNVSERTIRYDLEEIDKYLIANKLPPIIRETKVEVFLEKSNYKLDKLRELSKGYENEINYYLTKNRKHIIFLEILLSKELVDINLLMKKCDVSRSSIVGDIRKLRKSLKTDEVEIEYTSNRGYYLSGNENKIRKIGMKIIRLNEVDLNLSHQSIANMYFSNSDDITISIIEQFISKIEKDVNKQYSDISFQNIVYGILVAISRIKSDESLIEENNTESFSQEFRSIKKNSTMIEKELNIVLNDSEKKAIEQIFLESSLIKAQSVIDDNWLDLNLFIIEFLDRITQSLGIALNEEDLFEALVLHLGPAINRVRNETPFKNEVIEFIQNTYKEIYLNIKDILDLMGKRNNLLFTSDEIGFVTIHIASFIEKNELNTRNKSILLVCNYGVGTAKLLETLILKKFDFNIKGTFSAREINQSVIDDTNADFIISTVPIKENFSVPVIVVSPMLSEKDSRKLSKLENIRKEKNSSHYLAERKAEIIMLKELLIEETIELNVEAADWRESVRKGGELLKKSGKIEDEYIEAMINSVEELGPYIVIASEIAMPHASSKDGVYEVGLSLMTLKEAVNFGHPENDPVSIVICLAATDHNFHLNALKDLMVFLNEPDFIKLLKTGSKQEILDKINSEEN